MVSCARCLPELFIYHWTGARPAGALQFNPFAGCLRARVDTYAPQTPEPLSRIRLDSARPDPNLVEVSSVCSEVKMVGRCNFRRQFLLASRKSLAANKRQFTALLAKVI